MPIGEEAAAVELTLQHWEERVPMPLHEDATPEQPIASRDHVGSHDNAEPTRSQEDADLALSLELAMQLDPTLSTLNEEYPTPYEAPPNDEPRRPITYLLALCDPRWLAVLAFALIISGGLTMVYFIRKLRRNA